MITLVHFTGGFCRHMGTAVGFRSPQDEKGYEIDSCSGSHSSMELMDRENDSTGILIDYLSYCRAGITLVDFFCSVIGTNGENF